MPLSVIETEASVTPAFFAKSARLERGRPPGPARFPCRKAVRAVFHKAMAEAQDDRELVDPNTGEKVLGPDGQPVIMGCSSRLRSCRGQPRTSTYSNHTRHGPTRSQGAGCCPRAHWNRAVMFVQ